MKKFVLFLFIETFCSLIGTRRYGQSSSEGANTCSSTYKAAVSWRSHCIHMSSDTQLAATLNSSDPHIHDFRLQRLTCFALCLRQDHANLDR